MPETILESVFNGQLDLQLLLSWLQGDNLEGAEEDCLLRRCGRNEFTAYFLSFLRTETDSIVENDSGARAVVGTSTPERSEGRAHRRAASDPTADTPARPHHSPNREKKRSGRKVKTKLFSDERSKEPASPDDARVTTGIEKLVIATSTPLKADASCASPRGDTPRSACATPGEPRSRHSRHDATFGDFLSTASKGKKKRNSRNSDDSKELDLSAESLAPPSNNSSARKSSSLRSEKRRIKPTNIDLSKKSISLTSFSSDQPSGPALEHNEVFSAPPLLAEGSLSSPGFAAERDALRRERHRLLEKFSSLSAATSPKCTTPLIKISQDDDNFVSPDVSKVTCEERIDVFVKVYSVLLDCNLVLTYTNELCFMLALVRGRQKIDAVANATESGSVLRLVHNAACFAVRTLRSQRGVLTALLDRPSLRALAEARATKTMAPDLAKSLLDVYGLRGETATAEVATTAAAGHVVAWNTETDGQENFPSALSFHSFKKQRDMFYEIARWHGGGRADGPSLRTRVRALLGAGAAGGQPNLAHLGALIARHALATGAGGQSQESRLSKLQRRLTQPPAHQANSLFTPEEEFYRELLTCSENEPFRAAVRDALATELLALDAQPAHTGPALVSVWRRAAPLARLLGLLAALPYCPQQQPAPRPYRHLPYILALRSYAVPTLDVYGCVKTAACSGRLCVTLPWASAYLCVLAHSDAPAMRLPPYTRLLRLLRTLYRRRVPQCAARTALYLRCTLSTLFAQPNMPQEILYEDESDEDIPPSAPGPDTADIITETELGALLGARKEVASLLAGGPTGGPRHVTPLRVGPSPNRHTHRDTHIQKRLEEAVVRSCGGAGARRVLELVCERVSAVSLAHCSRALSTHRHKPTTACDVGDIPKQGAAIRAQLEAALGALLTERGGRGALRALAERAVRARLARHTRDTGELCEEAAAALKALVSGPWGDAPTPHTPPTAPTAPPTRLDVAGALIELKECVCLCMERLPPRGEVLCAALEGAERAAGGLAGGAARGVKRTALQLSVELCLALACSHPDSLSESVLRASERVWTVCTRGGTHKHGNSPPHNTVNMAPNDKGSEQEDDLSDIFSRLVSARVIRQVSSGHPAGWDALRKLVLWATERRWLCPSQLTESCVALYRRDWPQEVLSPLGALLRQVSGALETHTDGDPQLALFLGFLGEYCDDLAPHD